MRGSGRLPEVAQLRYATPDDPGIARRRSGRGFRYLAPDGRAISDEAELERIRRIAIPPAWTDVWICPDPNGHLQAVGRDARGRRQYRYHPRFRARRDRDKFARLVRFGRALPRIRRRVRADLATPGLSREKVIAAVVALLDETHLRVGNEEYARLNRSFGLSTLRSRHAHVAGASIRFRFRGKGGRVEERRLVDRRLAALVRRCRELPGQALFQYPDEDDPEQLRAVASEDVNGYIRDAAGAEEFSAKDFRTWAATLLAFLARDEPKAAIVRTAEAIGDTPTVTRNSYVHPRVLDEIDDEAKNAREAAPRESARRESTRREPATRKPAGRETARREPTRRDELALLAFLRSGRTSATRPKAKPRRSAARSGRRAA